MLINLQLLQLRLTSSVEFWQLRYTLKRPEFVGAEAGGLNPKPKYLGHHKIVRVYTFTFVLLNTNCM